MEVQGSKFKNINSVTCYMNSILHILQHIEIFIKFILINYNTAYNNNSIMYGLYNLLVESLTNEDKIIEPLLFRQIIGFKNSMWLNNEQQDSSEFLIFLISELENETKNIFNYMSTKQNILNQNIPFIIINLISSMEWNKNNTIIKNIFYGMTQIIHPCLYCHTSLLKNESFFIFQLYIPNIQSNINIYDCFNETIYNNNTFESNNQCNFCGLNSKYSETIKFWKTPQILIIQFRRYNNPNNKIITNIEYPIYDLNLKEYFNYSSPYINNCIYDLIGINIHNGPHIYYGHYTSIIKNIFNNRWYYYNDENPIIEIDDIKNLQNSNAYLLFYKLKN
jgi:ubiquitin C-terminal hydrolase